jgi:hypothetical protein
MLRLVDPNGGTLTAAADNTPGTARTRSSTRSNIWLGAELISHRLWSL